jgi:hypothetical protein
MPSSGGPGLEPVGSAVELETGDMVLDKAVTIVLDSPLSPLPARIGLYRRTDSGGWDWIGADREAAGVSGETRYLTGFGLFVDTAPPVVGSLRPGPGSAVRGARPEIFAGVDDTGSGFTWKDITVTIDDVPQIVVYDPESGTVRGRSRRDLPRGPHTWTVTVKDRAGNGTTRSAEFRVQ